jgi:hypothetical protein
MRRREKKLIDVQALGEHNPRVDATKLHKSLQIMQDLKACGVNFGPDYNLGSPYARPRPTQTKSTQQSQTAFRLRDHEL